jgi:hypothetical protein
MIAGSTRWPARRKSPLNACHRTPWPDALRERGYELEAMPDGERIVPIAIRDMMTLMRDGTLGTLTPGSTQPVSVVVHHPGIYKTKRFSFRAPRPS